MTVPVVVRGRQIVQFRLTPDQHMLGAGRPVVGTARGRRRSGTPAGTAAAAAGATSTAAAATWTAAAGVSDGRRPAAERRFLLLLDDDVPPVTDGHVHAGHEADTGLFLLGLYPAAAASIPSAAGHQRGPPPDDGQLLPPNPLQRIGHQPAIAVQYSAVYIHIPHARTHTPHSLVKNIAGPTWKCSKANMILCVYSRHPTGRHFKPLTAVQYL